MGVPPRGEMRLAKELVGERGNILSVKSSNCAAVVNICGGSCGAPWGGMPGKTASCLCGEGGPPRERWSITGNWNCGE